MTTPEEIIYTYICMTGNNKKLPGIGGVAGWRSRGRLEGTRGTLGANLSGIGGAGRSGAEESGE